MLMSANAEASATPSRRCAACKNQRRKCSRDCILAPYFPASDPQRYACVQRVFGASNIARVLQSLPVHERGNAADTMAMEAYRRVQDPVYGCAGVIVRLQEEIRAAQSELARTQAQIATHQLMNAQVPAPPPPPSPQQQAGDALTVQQEPFQGLDALLLDDARPGETLFDDDMSL